MIYRFQFRDLKEQLYTIDIQTGTATNLYTGLDIRALGEPPCTIEADSKELYAPIKSRSCTINLVMRDYVFDLYSKYPRHTAVTVKKGEASSTDILFFGYLTPCIYTQQYSYLDTVELEAVDAVSTLKDFTIPENYRFLQLNLKDLICNMLNSCGYTGSLYVPDSYDRLDGSSTSYVLDKLYSCGGNFFGDDDQHLPMSYYDVLTEILKFMGWSLCPDGMHVWLIDYRLESQGSVSYKPYSISSATAGTVVPKDETIVISKENGNIAPGTPTVSMDDIYNKITVSDNLFEVNELAPDLDSDTIHSSVTEAIEINTGTSALNQSQWTKQRRKSFLWWSWNSGAPQESTGIDFQTFCTFIPQSGWTHKFYHMYESNSSTHSHLENVTDSGTWSGCNWYDITNAAQDSDFKGSPINKYMNTVGCLMQHHALVPNTDNINAMPTSLDWNDYLTFFVLNDTAPSASSMSPAQIRGFELPVLEYKISEKLNYRPRTGTNWIVIGGELWYQSGGEYKDKDNKTWNLNMFGGSGSNQYFVTCPIDKPDVEGDLYYDSWNCKRESNAAGYGDGWPMWKMKLKIGDKYWNGSIWTTTESTFSLNFNNGPDLTANETEALVGYDWMKTCSNSTYKDKVGEDGYCIPITSSDIGVIGDLTLTIYCPSILPQGVSYGSGFDWKRIPNMVFVKDFSIDYIYTDEQVWYKQHGKSYKDDYIYTGYIDDDIPNKFSGLKLKLNTALAESPISRSFVCSSSGYISTLRHKTYSSGSGQVQEINLLDMYLDHYKEPKPIYEIDLHGRPRPWYKYSTQFLNGHVLLLDSYSYDLKYNKNRVKLISF